MSENGDLRVSEPTDTKQFTRLSVNINGDTEQVLQQHKSRGTSITETVRRAVSLLDLVDRQLADGGRVQLVDRDGNVRELIML